MNIQGINLQLHAPLPRPPKAVAGPPLVQPTHPARQPDWMKPLVAGQVTSGINRGEGFDELSTGTAPTTGTDASLKLYCRTADCVEAATGVTRGKMLDINA